MKKQFRTQIDLTFDRPSDWTDKDEFSFISYLIQCHLINEIDLKQRYKPFKDIHHAFFQNQYDLFNPMLKKIKTLNMDGIRFNTGSYGTMYNAYRTDDLESIEIKDEEFALTEEFQAEKDAKEEKEKLEKLAEKKARQKIEKEYIEQARKLKQYEEQVLKKERELEAELEASIRLPYAD